MGFMTLHEFCKMIGLDIPTPEELMKMSEEEREKHYWSTDRDVSPISFMDEPEYYDGENLMIYFDDRWLKQEDN